MIQLLNCSSADNLMFYRAAERADVDIVNGRVGLIRTLYCDIYIEYVDSESWKYLKKFDVFAGGGHGNPVDPCFHFIIVNTWNKPFIIDNIGLLFNGEAIPSENFSFIKDQNYTRDRFSLNILSLLKQRRILSDVDNIRDIDYESDSIEYRLNFIAPGDRISFFRFFQRIPSAKSFKIRLAIKYFDVKKVIDFDIEHFEYNEIQNIE